jgi:two-component system NtrC family sensor kinase
VQQPLVQRDTQWPARLAMWGVLAAPVLAAWSEFASTAPDAVKRFRLIVTLVAIFVGAALVFLRQYLVYQERTRLVHELWESLENVKRLQTHFVQSEKLASLGQLAAGAAHEINNPLTAILGYADVLTIENAANTRAHSLGDKIREQARRTKDLVNNLLSFARQVPAEKQLLDLNSVLTGAVQLRNLDLRGKNIRIELENRSILPAVRGDPNQLLQVFYHLISNAVDAMESAGGGVLLIRTLRERGNVVIEFSDTGPGMKEPEKVFDPFYTTKEVGKGTGLGLSICYGVMEEHGGRISGFNRPEGGCTFRLELPAILAVFPQTSTLPAAPVNTR